MKYTVSGEEKDMIEYFYWLFGELFYRFIRLATGKPNSTYKKREWEYEVDYFDFGFFDIKNIHGRKKQ